MIEAIAPEALVAVEPFVGFVHRLGAQPAGDDAAGLVASDQPGIRQHVEMLHHRRQRHRKRLGQRADREPVGLAQAGEQRAPGWVGERGKGAVERSGRIVNHVVKYRRAGTGVKSAFMNH